MKIFDFIKMKKILFTIILIIIIILTLIILFKKDINQDIEIEYFGKKDDLKKYKKNMKNKNKLEGIIDLWSIIPKDDIFIKLYKKDDKISCNLSISNKKNIWNQPVSNLPLIILKNNINYNHKLCFINEGYMYSHWDTKTYGTNIHFHNLQTDGYSDGSNMEQVMVPTKDDMRNPKINSFRPSINLKGNHNERTIIYHTHKHGQSADIAAKGGYGVGIIAPNHPNTGFKPSLINTYDYIIAIGGSIWSPIINFKTPNGKTFNNEIQMTSGKDIVIRFRVVCAFSGYSDFGRIKLVGDHETYIIADESGLLNNASYSPAWDSAKPEQPKNGDPYHMIITSGNRYEFMTKINGDTKIILETNKDEVFSGDEDKMYEIYNIICDKENLINTKYSKYTNFFSKLILGWGEDSTLGDPETAYNFGNDITVYNGTDPKIEKTRQVIYTGGMDMLWDVLREEHHKDVGGTISDGVESKVFKCKSYQHGHDDDDDGITHDTNKFTITHEKKTYDIILAPDNNFAGKLYSVNNFVKEINRQIKEHKLPLIFEIKIISVGPDDFKNNKYFDNELETSVVQSKDARYWDDHEFEFNVFRCRWYCGDGEKANTGAPKGWNIKIDAKNKYMALMIGIMNHHNNFSDKAYQLEESWGDPKVNATSITFNVDKGRTATTRKILGQTFSHGFINVNQNLDKKKTWEKWIVRNISGEPHNFHHHLFQSKILINKSSKWHNYNHIACGVPPRYVGYSRQYRPHLQAAKDTWTIPNGTYFSIICPIEYIKYPFGKIKENYNKKIAQYNSNLPYMVHCHFLPHEDMGMMSTFLVTKN
jgi:FtsP/CotA-like multicopper oxidase with cupredoxin domain